MAAQLKTGTCDKCQQTRPLFTFSYVPAGWFEFTEAELCTRCYSAAYEADQQGDIPRIPTAADREVDAQLAAAGKRL